MCILTYFCTPVSLHNKNDQWHSVDYHKILLLCCHHSLTLGRKLVLRDVGRDCSQADGDEPAGDWATFQDTIHDALVNKKFNAMLMFILFFPLKNTLRLPLLLFHESSSISFHRVQWCPIYACPFPVLVSESGLKFLWFSLVASFSSVHFSASFFLLLLSIFLLLPEEDLMSKAPVCLYHRSSSLGEYSFLVLFLSRR